MTKSSTSYTIQIYKSLENKELRLKNKSIASINFAKKGKLKLTSHGNYMNTNQKLTKDLDQKKMKNMW